MKKEELPFHLTPEELAARWDIHKGTLCNWRVKGIGPKYVKVGRTILYPVSEVESYEKNNQKVSTVS